MISDTFDKLTYYQRVIPAGTEIVNYLIRNDISSFDKGKYTISGESVFLLIQEYQTKSGPEKVWESHKKYIDIQIVLKGQEYMGYSSVSLLKIKESYNAEKDIILYENDDREHSMIFVPEQCFCIFFPEDAHKPGCHISFEHYVKKAVIKVLLLDNQLY